MNNSTIIFSANEESKQITPVCDESLSRDQKLQNLQMLLQNAEKQCNDARRDQGIVEDTQFELNNELMELSAKIHIEPKHRENLESYWRQKQYSDQECTMRRTLLEEQYNLTKKKHIELIQKEKQLDLEVDKKRDIVKMYYNEYLQLSQQINNLQQEITET